jgi:hypothetical protein
MLYDKKYSMSGIFDCRAKCQIELGATVSQTLVSTFVVINMTAELVSFFLVCFSFLDSVIFHFLLVLFVGINIV